MGLVVGGEVDRQVGAADLLPDDLLDEELLFGPHRNGLEVAAQTAGGELHVGREEAVELQERLLVEDDAIEVLGPCTR